MIIIIIVFFFVFLINTKIFINPNCTCLPSNSLYRTWASMKCCMFQHQNWYIRDVTSRMYSKFNQKCIEPSIQLIIVFFYRLFINVPLPETSFNCFLCFFPPSSCYPCDSLENVNCFFDAGQNIVCWWYYTFQSKKVDGLLNMLNMFNFNNKDMKSKTSRKSMTSLRCL